MNEGLIAVIVPVVAALTSLVRKYIPEINGAWVVLLSNALGVIIACTHAWQQIPHNWEIAIFSGLTASAIAVGGTEYLTRLSEKSRS